MEARELRRRRPGLESFLDRYAPRFGRPEARAHARRFVQGLLLGGERRSVENIAEAIGGCVVRSLQQFITTAPWDTGRHARPLPAADRRVGGLDLVERRGPLAVPPVQRLRWHRIGASG